MTLAKAASAKRKSWCEKLADNKDLPKVVPLSGKLAAKWGQGKLVIAAPCEVDEVMRRVPRGKLISLKELRAVLAKKHCADVAFPITTGIFAWIAAHATQERLDSGKKRVTRFWRTLKTGGELNAKYPGGIAALKRRLEAEGHRIVQRGKKFVVADYEKSLAR